jgi:hypothetical protein
MANRTLANATLDRVVHNAYRIDLTGESMRKQRAPVAPENTEARHETKPVPNIKQTQDQS